mmetsp:Transcript_5340/g.17124  ORF Transcript_5340/g.17124 Transcript_5340/m.17124 type:complete len:103 (-) Transcript_5340:58-366(-)
MDYKGQVYNEYAYQLIFALFGIVCFALGYVQEDFGVTINGWIASLVVAGVVCVPDWPVFNREPVKWHGKATTATRALTLDELENDTKETKKARVRNALRRAK